MNIKKQFKFQLLMFLVFSFVSIFSNNVKIKSLNNLLYVCPEIEYIKCSDVQLFKYKMFPISKFPQFQPNEGLFAPTFILKIKNGAVGSNHGFIKVNDVIIKDLLPPYWSISTQIKKIKELEFSNVKHIDGKVAVITMLWDDNYFHWIANVLTRLALLELNGIEYDWLYVAQDKPFMKETLSIFGIDSSKIIQPFGDTKFIQADELIVPSHIGIRIPLKNQYLLDWVPIEQYAKLWNITSQTLFLSGNDIDEHKDIIQNNVSIDDFFISRTPLCSGYFQESTINYIKAKFLSCIEGKKYDFAKKVFISRADSQFRKIINEDEVFKVFEQCGFTRYVLSNLSIKEQVALFNGADIVVAAHGAGLINILFCKPETKIIEIFQTRSDSCFCYLSQLLNLNYNCIQTVDFTNLEEFKTSSIIPVFIIKKFINNVIERKQ